MFEILITAGDYEMKSIITEDQLKEVFRLLEQNNLYRLDYLHRIDNGVAGEELIYILKKDIDTDLL